MSFVTWIYALFTYIHFVWYITTTFCTQNGREFNEPAIGQCKMNRFDVAFPIQQKNFAFIILFFFMSIKNLDSTYCLHGVRIWTTVRCLKAELEPLAELIEQMFHLNATRITDADGALLCPAFVFSSEVEMYGIFWEMYCFIEAEFK